MINTRNRLYSLVLAVCTVGFGWLLYHRFTPEDQNGLRFCFLKTATGLPCPACGTTRAVDALLSGHIMEAIQWNPFGFPVALIMMVAPVWIVCDFLVGSDSFFRLYKRAELKLSAAGIALPLIVLVLVNWIWNYYKGY